MSIFKELLSLNGLLLNYTQKHKDSYYFEVNSELQIVRLDSSNLDLLTLRISEILSSVSLFAVFSPIVIQCFNNNNLNIKLLL